MSHPTPLPSPLTPTRFLEWARSLPPEESLTMTLQRSPLALEVARRALENADAEGRHNRLEDEGGVLHLWIGKQPKHLRRPPQCGAMTRKGTPCKCLAVPGRTRCKLHGGASTGPKTPEGRAKIAASNRARAAKKKRRED